VAVDIDTFKARLERGREFRFLNAHDHRGRIFSDHYLEEEGPYREELSVRFAGRRRVLCVEEGTWGEPIAGNFRVIDRRGTLLERRRDRWLSGDPGLPPTAVEIIRKGRRETLDLGLPGPIAPVSDSGWVVLKDSARGRVVFRSLDGRPDRWLPEEPPLRGEFTLREE
jgi:hypothetical protein